MERPKFNLMNYPVRVVGNMIGARTVDVMTFAQEPTSAPPYATISAPPGSELWAPAAKRPKLKVPKPGKVREYDVLSAQDAYESAVAGRDGLALEGGSS